MNNINPVNNVVYQTLDIIRVYCKDCLLSVPNHNIQGETNQMEILIIILIS